MEHDTSEQIGKNSLNNINSHARNKGINFNAKDNKFKQHSTVKISLNSAKVRLLNKIKKISFIQDSKKLFESSLISYFNRNFK